LTGVGIMSLGEVLVLICGTIRWYLATQTRFAPGLGRDHPYIMNMQCL